MALGGEDEQSHTTDVGQSCLGQKIESIALTQKRLRDGILVPNSSSVRLRGEQGSVCNTGFGHTVVPEFRLSVVVKVTLTCRRRFLPSQAPKKCLTLLSAAASAALSTALARVVSGEEEARADV